MRLLSRFLVPVMFFVILILVGAYVYHQAEGWRYLDSIYFTVITAATIGYGDFVPVTDAGKIFTMFFSFAGIGMAFYFFSVIGRYMFKKQLRNKLLEEGRLTKSRGVKKVKKELVES